VDTTRNAGTLTLQIVGVTSEHRLPILMTGVFVRISAQQTPEVAGAQRRRDERSGTSGPDGRIIFRDLPVGRYEIFVGPPQAPRAPREQAVGPPIDVQADCDAVTEVRLQTTLSLRLIADDDPDSEGHPLTAASLIPYARPIRLRIVWRDEDRKFFRESDIREMRDARVGVLTRNIDVQQLPIVGDYRDCRLFAPQSGPASFLVYYGTETGRFPPSSLMTFETDVAPPAPTTVEGSISVGLRRTPSRFTEDVPLWVSIRKSTDALSFDRYYDFMNWLFCNDPHEERLLTAKPHERMFDRAERRRLPFTDTDAYRNIKVATEAFVMANCGIFTEFDRFDAQYVIDQVVVPTSSKGLANALDRYLEPLNGGSPGVLPYLAIIRRKLIDQRIKDTDIGDVMLRLDREHVDACYGLLRQKLTCPCLLELIWSYWQEEGMLAQTMNTLLRRFQNVRSPLSNDPLANLEIDPLRPLNNLIWGLIQDEQHRLSVLRRNYEYDHHYGLRLAGRAVQDIRAADTRSKFLEAFHTLLSITSAFYKRDDDTTIVADGFPVLNALKEAHLILSQGAHNQYGDLPSTARIEMLMEQWILSRPEFREFLPTRIMVAYPEPWMDRVDAMKKLQGWTDTSVLHFRNLAIFGEQVLLSIRYGAWAGVIDPVQATNWARYWRPEIQGYVHAYRSVTGVDLSVEVTNARIDATMPSVYLVQRLNEQQGLVGPALPRSPALSRSTALLRSS
jgi:hypothetical protein